MTNEQLVIELKKRKSWLLLFIIIAFGGCLYLQFTYYNNFNASNDFSVTSSETIDLGSYAPNEPERFFFDRSGTNMVFTVINSTEMFEHLIGVFHLYEHYHLDSLAVHHYENVMAKLAKNISVKKTDYNILSLTIKDKDPATAAMMANEAVKYINVIFKNQYLFKLRQKISYYEGIMQDVRAQDSLQKMHLYSILRDIKAIAPLLERQSLESDKLHDKLIGITEQLQNSSDNYLRAFQLYRSAYGALKEYDFQTVTVIRKAIPDYDKAVLKKLATSAVITVFLFCGLVLLIYFYLVHKDLLRLIYSKGY